MQRDDIRVEGTDEVDYVGKVWSKYAVNVQCHVSETGGERGRGFGEGISCSEVYFIWDRRDGENMLNQGDSCVLFGRGSGRGWERIMGMV